MHTGGLINPRSWYGRCRAGVSNAGALPLSRKEGTVKKAAYLLFDPGKTFPDEVLEVDLCNLQLLADKEDGDTDGSRPVLGHSDHIVQGLE